jgi:transposase, IS5 family
VAVDTAIQAKLISFPTDARLIPRAFVKVVALAKRCRVPLRQSYLQVAKRAAILIECYLHAHQFGRAHQELRFCVPGFGRGIRDTLCKIPDDAVLEGRFRPLLTCWLGFDSRRNASGPKVQACAFETIVIMASR